MEIRYRIIFIYISESDRIWKYIEKINRKDNRILFDSVYNRLRINKLN